MYRIFFIGCLSFVFGIAQAQEMSGYSDKAVYVQLGLSGGAMNCLTDLGGKSNVFKTFKPAGGFYIGFLYNNAIGARLETTWGSVTGSDANAKDVGVRERNLSFSSNISEISLLAEIHPLHFSSNYTFPLSPYILAGVGTFSFNPTTKINGNTILLQPLHTEGEGFLETGRPNYKLSQTTIPIGGGLAYQISSLFTVKGELVYRVLNTDYLDDVSTIYIDPSLFDKHLSAGTADLAKKLAFRTGELVPNANVPVGGKRGSTAKDSYYSINIKLQFNL